MLYYVKNEWRIPKVSCQSFVTCCQTCNRKRAAPKRGVVVKPIVSNGLNMRGQVNLIDFQSYSDGEYTFLMNYQDHATKFLHLRPLKSKHAKNVAEELSIIFFTFGVPQILQSDNRKEFVAGVIHELGFFIFNIFFFCHVVPIFKYRCLSIIVASLQNCTRTPSTPSKPRQCGTCKCGR